MLIGFKQIIEMIQSRGSAIFKIAAVNFFNWIVDNNLFDKVKMCIPVHDK